MGFYYGHMTNGLKQFRNNLSLSQQQLADIVGTSKGQISKLESGKLRLSDYWMNRIAKALNENGFKDIEAWHMMATDQSQAMSELEKKYYAAPEHVRQTINDLLGIDGGNDGKN